MLVFTRQTGESIKIGDDIEIFLTEIKSRTAVKIGIDAPTDVPVHRREIWDRIQGAKNGDGVREG